MSNKKHTEDAYIGLQAERDAFKEAADVLEMLVEKAFKEGFRVCLGSQKDSFIATRKWLESESRALLKED